MATEDLTTQAGWDAFLARHGGLVGQPSKTSPDFDTTSGRRIADPFYRYSMADGSSVTINGAGQIDSIDEKAPSTATGTAQPNQGAPTTRQYTVANADGSSDTYQYRWDPSNPQQPWKLDTSFPVEHKAAPQGARPPSDPSQWQPIHANPSDPSSPIIALQDPTNSSNRVSVPQGAQPSKPTITQEADGATYSWDGTTLTKLIDAKPDKPQIVQGAGGVGSVWDGKTLQQIGGPTEGA